MDKLQVRRRLLAWYDENGRDLPWRRNTDPYAVLVSEVMLQQTRVDVVIPFFERWLARWPTVADLAEATEDEVIAAWAGLGYYRRARNLLAAARLIHADGWPTNLRDLPGVGPYIAGAVGSIAFGTPVPAIDGNVQRVVARWFAIGDDITKAAGRTAIEHAAASLLDADRPGDWTQAVMELGAMVCTPLKPKCSECPVAATCRSVGDADHLPVKTAKQAPLNVAVHFALIHQEASILLTKRPEGLLGGTWGLPGGDAGTPLEDHVQGQAGMNVRLAEDAGSATHTFSHRRWHMQIHAAQVVDVDHRQPAQLVRWTPLEELDDAGLSTAMRKAINAGLANAGVTKSMKGH